MTLSLVYLSLLVFIAPFTLARDIPGGDDYIEAGIALHNFFRSIHGAPDIVGDPELHESAQKRADYLAGDSSTEPDDGDLYGENIFQLDLFITLEDSEISLPSLSEAVKTAIGKWYGEIAHYDFDNPGQSRNTDQFTQLVWKGSQSLGVGINVETFEYEDGWWLEVTVVCHYSPPGNVEGEFEANVEPARLPITNQ